MRRTPTTLVLAFAGCFVLAFATFLPWQETALYGEVSGFGSGGWATLILAVIAAWNLAMWRWGGRRRDAYLAALVGGGAILASGYLLFDFSTRTEGLFEESTISDPMIGAYVALGGAILLAVSALLLARSVPERAVAPRPASAAD